MFLAGFLPGLEGFGRYVLVLFSWQLAIQPGLGRQIDVHSARHVSSRTLMQLLRLECGNVHCLRKQR